MKKTLQTLLFASIAMLMPIGLSAHDFKVGGIYYNITSAEDKTVEVTFSGEYDYTVDNEYTGKVAIPATVTHGGVTYRVVSIGGSAFRGCKGLTSITISNSVTSIGGSAFYGCSGLTSITIPSSVTFIGSGAFYKCTSLTSITLPSSVTSIGSNAFYYCSSLTAITLPEGVTSIGNDAFYKCTSLTSITIPEGVTSIGSSAFYGCSGLTSITLPEGVTSIENGAFEACTSLASVTIPEGVTSIGEEAFNNCTSLTSVILPEGVTSIGEYAFYYCTSLASITIPKSVTSIESSAFFRCTSLTSITIPKSVTSIGRNAFYKCMFLQSNFINNSKCSDATNWGAIIYTKEEEVDGMIIRDNVLVAARGNLTIANIPEGVTIIGDDAFYYCTSLASITIPEGVTSIGSRAFSGCSGLTDVYYLGSAEQWEAIEIGGSNESLTNATRHYYDANGFCTAHERDYQPAPLNAEGYYEIANGGQLFWFAQQVNEGGEEARNLKAVLKNDIDLEGRSWTPIGATGGTTSQSFRGVFDGNGKIIRGLYVDAQRSALGLFGEVRKGVVKDFTIYGEVKLNGKYNYVGGVIGSACGIQGDNGSAISGITSYVNVTLGEGSHGSNHVAGLIGYVNHNTTVERCTWLGTLDLDIYRAQDGVGGLIGKANPQYVGTISDCAAYGTIRTAYQSGSYVNPSDSQPFTNIFIGGIVSNSLAGATTNIENCIWAGNIVNETDLGKNAHIAAIGTLNGVGNVANCYYLEGSVPEVTTHNAYDTNGKVFGVSLAQLMNGEIAAKLGEAWGQNIDGEGAKDAKPVVGGAKLYYGYLSCDENAPMAYTNNAEVSEVRPEHNHVEGFCTVCGHIDAEGDIVIRDGKHTAFAITDDIDMASITYTRNFKNTNWQALYVPFEIPVTAAFLAEFEVADLNDVRQYDHDDDGVKDETVVEAFKVKSGVLEANYPYLIRAKVAGEKNIVVTDAVLHATEENSIDCSSVREKFTFTGTYSRIPAAQLPQSEGYYALSGGVWQPIASGSSLGAFRFYMQIESRNGGSAPAQTIRMRVIDEDDATEIDNAEFTDGNSQLIIYDLQGRRITDTANLKGVYIVNGKKVIF